MKLERESDILGRSEYSLSSDGAFASTANSLASATITELQAYRDALDCAAIVATTDLRGRITEVNEQFCTISEFSRDELVGAPHNIVNSGHHERTFFRNLWKTIASGNVWRGDILNRAKSGKPYWVDTTIAPLQGPGERPSGYVSIRFDITDRKAAETRLVEELARRQGAEDLLRDIMETVPSGIVTFDSEGKFRFGNRAFHDLYRHMAQRGDGARPGRTQPSAPHDADLLPAMRDLWPNSRRGDGAHPAKPYVTQLSADKWVQVNNSRSTSGNFVSVQTDISDLKQAELLIKYQAEKDALTGLCNRNVLIRRLKQLNRARDGDTGACALLLIDLDNFKAINDRYGHDGGDDLLCVIARRLRSSLRQGDTAARLGGDEFAVLLQEVDSQRDAATIAQGLLKTMRQPVSVGKHMIQPSASIGIAMFPRDGKSPKELMKNADLALYQSKFCGRNRHSIYSRSMRRERRRRDRLEEWLRSAITQKDLAVALQPQTDLRTGSHAGFEALVRWQHGRREIAPVELISVAEEAGLICELGYLVIEKGLAAVAAMKRMGLCPGNVAFNASSAQLLQPDFSSRLMDLVHAHGLRGEDIEIEVTENVMLDRSAAEIARVLRGLHERGVSVALDDFGTGYASLTHLKQFPINRLKIDRSFIQGILDDKDDGIIVRSIISLAHGLGCEVVAEGVEVPAQYRQLSNFGCDFVQGYLLAKPMQAADAENYLAALEHTWPTMRRSHETGL
ncbi:EAL domain-containing protein [Novosphingobium malaysiense]|uniref:EAL domain-containing protein n=1 Tax=Novosphingobium malaysiense TaxID=1348853 RepID=UPI0006924663|nr:EAL domain-containing protein [Novosphingobium malaysiense]